MPLSAGTRLGPYEILALIGAGGMGEVYRAHDPRMGRDVAIKVAAERFSDRFSREVRAIAALNHPNICTLYDVGPNYLVMELVEGPTLAERIKEGAIPLDEALGIANQIADALEAAHEKGITHRDLKPGNVKVKPGGAVKVLDFGLAKQSRDYEGAVAGDPEHSPTLTIGATEAGTILGTMAYMSPEQARGKPVDKRADIWAFGVVLYEMLTGQQPFQGEDVAQTLAAVIAKEPSWEPVPVKVQRLLKRCLEKDPQKRLRDITGVGLLLEETPQGPEPASLVPRHSKVPWVVAALAAGIAVWGWLHSPAAEPRPVTRWTAATPTADALPGLGLSLSRDGTRLAYVQLLGGSPRIWVRTLDQAEGKPVSGAEGGLRPFFSPDGQWLAYFTGPTGPLKKVPVTGGPPITLCDGVGFFGGSWGEDDRIILSGTKGLMRVSAAGGTCESVTTADPQKGELHRWPQILPGGQAILFTIGTTGSFDSARIAVLDLKSRGYRVVANGGSSARYVPSGHLVYVRGGAMFAVPFDLKRLAVTGTETPVIEGVFYRSSGGFADYSFSNSGLLVYMPDTQARNLNALEWLDRKGTAQTLPAPPQEYGSVRLSPDGQRAAVTTGRPGGNNDIQIVELARGTLTRLTSAGQNISAVWTPDGERLAFYSLGGGIYWMPADGSGRPERLLANVVAAPSSWTPDGKALLYNTIFTPFRIWTLPVSGSARKPQPLLETAFNDADAQISPDGRWVAYMSDESGKWQVYARPFPGPGAKASVSIEGGRSPRWSRDGRELFYRDPGKNQLMAVDIQTTPTLRAGQPHALFALSEVPWDAAPDGKRFLVVKTPEAVVGEAKMQVVVNWFEELRRRVPASGK